MSQQHEPARVNRVSRIMKSLIDSAYVGDEVELGLKGEPAFPDAYRGAARPKGTILSIDGEVGTRAVTIGLTSGSSVVCEEDNHSGRRIWEFSEKGFRGVQDREEVKYAAAQREQKTVTHATPHLEVYRGDMKNELEQVKAEMSNLRNVCYGSIGGLASEVKAVSKIVLGEKSFRGGFSSQLMEHMDALSIKYKGTPTAELQFSDSDAGLSD